MFQYRLSKRASKKEMIVSDWPAIMISPSGNNISIFSHCIGTVHFFMLMGGDGLNN
jgi:hypothetical protein